MNYLQLITEWKKTNDEIVLDSTDLNAPFSAKFNKGTFYTKNQYYQVFIEYRNNYLLSMIDASSDNNILVI